MAMSLNKEGGMRGSGTDWNSISGVLVILFYLCHRLLKSKLFEIIHLQDTSIAKVKEIHKKIYIIIIIIHLILTWG